MRTLDKSEGLLVECWEDVPNFSECTRIVCDIETTSGDPKLESKNPWHHCKLLGLAIQEYTSFPVYYLPREFITLDWLHKTFSEDTEWINHNVKYDATVLYTDYGFHFQGRLTDTLTGAKLVNSDRFNYSLDHLANDWFKQQKQKDSLAPYLENSKDFGDVPRLALADYACHDVRLTKRLQNYIENYMPERSQQVYETEKSLTKVLFDSELRGLRVWDEERLSIEEAKITAMLLNDKVGLYTKLAELAGEEFEPHISGHCHRVFREKFRLPILEETDKGNPSYSHHVLKQYLAIPGDHVPLVKLSLKWKELWQYLNLYIDPYKELNVDGIIHSSYNQCVRTGRMSCRWPNMQQLSKRAKGLILPRDGYTFLSIDYAQVEFRIIVHYIQNRYAIEAYRDNPDTDFHTWVAQMVGIPRRPAKNINFMLGYGGGKKKTLAMLQDQPDLINEIRETCDTDEAFKLACRYRASQVYQTYHETLPELKRISQQAGDKCRRTGSVRNVYGRVRKLPGKAAHKAFNNLCQSSAADLTKERAVALVSHLEGIDAHLVAVVHDEFLIEVRKEALTKDLVKSTVELLETPSVPLRVPIRCSVGVTEKSWKEVEEIDPNNLTQPGALVTM